MRRFGIIASNLALDRSTAHCAHDVTAAWPSWPPVRDQLQAALKAAWLQRPRQLHEAAVCNRRAGQRRSVVPIEPRYGRGSAVRTRFQTLGIRNEPGAVEVPIGALRCTDTSRAET